jgi:hypothetical protein
MVHAYGGQRWREVEVWALKTYAAAFMNTHVQCLLMLQHMPTVMLMLVGARCAHKGRHNADEPS